jgi:thiol-disulfide isomerase/thioredoxin
VLAVAVSAAQAKLKVGDPAPPIAVSKFVKGDPVEKFDPGKVYVMEFWATWCGPCIQAIPHVTELQKKYKDKGLVVIGTSVWEREADQSKVEPFVEKMGDKMDYVVAMDDRSDGGKGKMADTWLAAAGQNGIPCSFIVDQKGKIAWIGHPMAMDQVLEKVIAGNYDGKSQAAVDEAMEQFAQAWRAGEREKAIKIANAKFAALKDEPQALNEIAWAIAGEGTPGKAELNVAERFAKAAVDATKGENAAILDTLAAVHFKKGEIAQAVKIQEQAVAKADDAMRGELEQTLQKYKEAKGS